MLRYTMSRKFLLLDLEEDGYIGAIDPLLEVETDDGIVLMTRIDGYRGPDISSRAPVIGGFGIIAVFVTVCTDVPIFCTL